MLPIRSRALVGAVLLLSSTARAQQAPAKPDSTTVLDKVKVVAAPAAPTNAAPILKLTLPVTASIDATRIRETVNAMDTEDAVKYLPSIFLRKRNNGDTQAVMATRVWGVSSSARSLIYADGIPLTALIANNNTIGGPRWGLVAPSEIARIDMMYGPFSAAYGGNSMGAVMEITTRMPNKREGSIEQSGSLQSFDLYGTAKSFGTSQTAATFGDRIGKFAFWASGNYQKSNSQPLSYVTGATFPTGTTGGYTALNKLGAAANVLGASGLLQTGMLNAKLKTTYDLTPTLRASYSYGMWQNDATASLDSYIAKGTDPTYAAQAGFASGNYELFQRHSAHALSLRSNTNGTFDFDLSATSYRFDFDKQRTPTTAPANGTSFTGAGRVAALDGSGWQTFDAKGIWRPDGVEGTHTVTFGAHHEQYRLFNPTYNVADWRAAQPYTGVATEGDGKTRTQALWAQDRWRLSPSLVFTVGGRYETYRAFDGYNVNGNTKITQPTLEQTKFSPKGVLAWTPNADWTLSASVAKAYRFATAAELYQLVSTGVTFTSPNPTLKPDDVLATELRVERTFERAKVQVALFQDEVHDAIISQFLPLVAGSNTLFSYISNVDHVRARGVELVVSEHDMLVKGLEFGGSVTYLDARTVSTAGRPSATAAVGSANGKKLPNIPDWRASFTATYRPTARLAITGAGRYSDKLWTTLDNADVNPNVYQGFSGWFVADAKASYTIDQHWSASLGVDNLLNRKYFLFHPFPQRTWVASVRFGF